MSFGAAMQVDVLWRHARLMTMTGGGLGLVDDGVVAALGGRLVHVGPRAEAPALQAVREVDCGGRLLSPGLIDCHTHLVFGGDRCAEFEARLAGRSYAELAAIGGIRASVAATRAASDAALQEGALQRLDAMLAQGVTTVEIKSGYGLDVATELRMLRVARGLGTVRAVRVVTSLLAAHAVPPGCDHADAYIDEIVDVLLPAVCDEKLADAVDGFCETIAFSPAQIARVFVAARAAGLRVKLHADQLSDGGGAELAARFGALSADHLEYASAAGVTALAAAGSVAVMLPGAFYALRETRVPPVAAFRAAGVPMAVATDCNPGSSPLVSPLLAMNMACVLFGLTVEEALRGMTCHAAQALGRDDIGVLAVGARADLAIWSVGKPAELVYWMGANPSWQREFAG